MKLQVTKVLTKRLNEDLSDRLSASFHFMEFLPEDYETIVSAYLWENEADYNMKNGKMKAIRVEYDPEFYAMPGYLTTKRLQEIARSAAVGNSITWDAFCDELVRELEI